MKLKQLLSFFILILSLCPGIAYAGNSAVTISPFQITIPSDMQSVRSLSYIIKDRDTAPNIACLNAASSKGEFKSGSIVLGTVNTPISEVLIGSIFDPGPPVVTEALGTSSKETIVISRKVIKRAKDLGINKFNYERTFQFTGPGPCVPSQATGIMKITVNFVKTARELEITRLQLRFDNKRPEITVKKHQPSLMAYARISFIGSGLFQGFWEVDGRILSHVRMHLYYGKDMILETPQIPGLPTFKAGTHRVRFVVTEPAGGFDLPFALYEVTPELYEARLPIVLTGPTDRSAIEMKPQTFSWKGKEKIATYLIQFFEEGGITPIWSAYTKEAEYAIPALILQKMFLPEQQYFWQVKGFNAETDVVAESDTRTFTFQKP